MSWFLGSIRSKSKAKATSATRPPRSPRQPWDKQRTLQGLRWLASGVIIAAVVLGWKFGQPRLVGYTSQKHAVMITGEQVTLVDCPTWMHADIQRDLRWLVAGQLAMDPMNAGTLQQAVDALAANPWVQSVRRIERTSKGVTVEAMYREPVALVMSPRRRDTAEDYLQKTDALHLVDARGVRLPSDSTGSRDVPYRAADARQLNLPVIVGVASPSPRPGQLWNGDDLQAGLKLAAMLHGEPYAGQVVAYDVSGRDSFKRVRLALRTKAGGTVWWGLPPGQEKTIEPDAAVKRRWLAFLNAPQREGGRGSIDAGGQVVELFRFSPIIKALNDEPGTTPGATVQRTRAP